MRNIEIQKTFDKPKPKKNQEINNKKGENHDTLEKPKVQGVKKLEGKGKNHITIHQRKS